MEENSNSEEIEVVNPGDCIGHWLDGDDACSECEIEDSCKQMTQNLNGDANSEK